MGVFKKALSAGGGGGEPAPEACKKFDNGGEREARCKKKKERSQLRKCGKKNLTGRKSVRGIGGGRGVSCSTIKAF